jgi:uncharacterized protein (DUF736 family)
MAIIGSFTKQEDGSFRGTISTPLVNGRAVITSIEKMGDKAPDYRVYLGKYELGAAWSTTSKDGKSTYLSVKLTPHFLPPLSCRLVEMEKEHVLIVNN